MSTGFICPRCGNSDARYIGYKYGQPYCRKCVSFCGVEASKDEGKVQAVSLDLKYSLSKEQKALSEKIIENFKNGIDTLIYAVCGSGKTEISYGVIAYAMSKGMHVGFALPRRDVVIELYWRLKSAFPNQKIIAVYGQHNSELEGDCIILTTHQLYRYPAFFDLLVMDEIDAFPFKGNEVLISIYRKSLRGHCVMMSATPSKSIVKEFKGKGKDMLTLHTRFHKQPIPVPENIVLYGPLQVGFIAKKLIQYRKEEKQCFVFVPKVRLAESLHSALRVFVPGGNYVSSKREGRPDIIQSFKDGKIQYLVTTAVMERGITVKNLQVIVFHADDYIYDAAALIQIAGRAGRKGDAPKGDVYFVAEKITKGMEGAIREIKYCNTFL